MPTRKPRRSSWELDETATRFILERIETQQQMVRDAVHRCADAIEARIDRMEGNNLVRGNTQNISGTVNVPGGN
jgi:hypothetical protein